MNRSERTWRWCRRNPSFVGLAASIAGLLMAIAGLSTAAYVRESSLRDRAEKGELEAERAFTQLKASHAELEMEQKKSADLRQDIDNLDVKRRALEQSLSALNQSAKATEQKLYRELIDLARIKLTQTEWQEENVVEAQRLLDECPPKLRGREWYALENRCRPPSTTFHAESCVTISSDGTLIASTYSTSENRFQIRIGEIGSSKQLRTLSVQTSAVTCLAFRPDGKSLASGGADGEIRIWNLGSGEREQTLTGHTGPIAHIEFSRDGRRFVSASQRNRKAGNEVLVWDGQTFEQTRVLDGFNHVAISPDGRLAACAADAKVEGDGRAEARSVVQIWNLEERANEPWLSIPNDRSVFAFSSDGRRMAVVKSLHFGERDTIEIINLETSTVEQRIPVRSTVQQLMFSSDDRRLAFCLSHYSMGGRYIAVSGIWNVETRSKERIWPVSTVRDMAYCSDMHLLATAGDDKDRQVRLWDVSPPADPTDDILTDIAELDVGRYDWPQWGGSRFRVNAPSGVNIPTDWDVGHFSGKGERERTPGSGKNIKWAVRLGSQTYGNPVVANGKVFVGTNNHAAYLPRYPRSVDLGVLLCFEEETGKFLWQHSNPKLPTGRVHDWPDQGVCSTPVLDGDRLWYVTNRGEVVCLDTEGNYDNEDDGPFRDEWEQLFSVALSQFLEGELKSAFAGHGFEWPVNNYFRWNPDFRWNPANNRWIIRGRQGNQVGRLFDVHEKDATLVVSKTDSPAGEELFTVESPTLAAWGTPKMLSLLEDRFAAHGVSVAEDVALYPGPVGSSWSFVSQIDGRDRDLQLRREFGWLTVFQDISSQDDKHEADVVWKLDMIGQLGVSPHNMSNCSMITADGMLFVCTSNGVDESHINIPAPDAPSFIALDRESGQVVWSDNSPGENIMHAQWASPSYGVFGGQPQVIFPGGDGWVYSFDPKGDGNGGARLLWKFDGNPKDSRWELGGRGTRNNIIAFPAIYDGLVYIVMGQDPEHGEGLGRMWCVDPAKRMDGSDVSAELAVDQAGHVIPHRRLQAVDLARGERAIPNPDSAVIWEYTGGDLNGNGEIEWEEEFHRSLSIPTIRDDILYIADFSGLFHCLNAKTGEPFWTYDLFAQCWGSALLVDGKVYIGDEDGDVAVFQHSTQRRLLNEVNMNNSMHLTPIVANDVLYIATKDYLFAIQEPSASSVGSLSK